MTPNFHYTAVVNGHDRWHANGRELYKPIEANGPSYALAIFYPVPEDGIVSIQAPEVNGRPASYWLNVLTLTAEQLP